MKQNAFATCEEMRASVVISVPRCVQDFGHGRDRDTVVCPKPRRIGSFNPHAMAEPFRPLQWHVSHQQEVCDAKAGTELLGLILAKIKYIRDEQEKRCLEMKGLNLMDKTLFVKGARIAFRIWDVGGDRRSLDQVPIACKDAVAILFMFDLTSRCTLNSVIGWYTEARKWNQR